LAILDEALQIFGRRFWLIAAIVLTVWLPGNIAMEIAVRALHWTDNATVQFQLNGIVGAVLDPLVTAALIFVTFASKLGYAYSYRQAMATGVRRWPSLFATRLGTGFLLLGGFVLLLVPGILLALRWALIDPVVVLEGIDGGVARRRSSELTQGRRRRILGIALGSYLGIAVCVFILSIPKVMIPALGLPYDVALDCAGDFATAFMTIVWALFFIAARGDQPVDVDAGAGTGPGVATPGADS